MTKKNKNILIQYLMTFVISTVFVFAVSICVELELLFRCENEITAQEIAFEKLSKYYSIEQLKKQLQTQPKNYIINIRLAQDYEDLGDYDMANAYYTNALSLSNRANFVLYKYALFCARRSLYTLSATYAEELSGNNPKIYAYKAYIYELIADGLFDKEQFAASVKAYQIAFKYAKTIKNHAYLEKMREKYARSYVGLADYYVEQDKIFDAISALQNSMKIKESSISKYKLALIYLNIDKIKAERYMYSAFCDSPYIVNPYIYEKLLSDLIVLNSKDDPRVCDYYAMKLKRLNKKLKNCYIANDDIKITNSGIVKQKAKFSNKYDNYLVFNLENISNDKISQLYIMAEIFSNTDKYHVSKKIIKQSTTLRPQDKMEGIVLKLDNDYKIDEFLKNNAPVVKYYAKKSYSAPWTLVKIETSTKI